MQLAKILPLYSSVAIIVISAAALLLLARGTEHGHLAPMIAIATEGRNTEIVLWLELLNHMESKNHITLFLLSYNAPLESQLCSKHSKVICLFEPNSTWTSGRNILARTISQFEKNNPNHHGNQSYFKYWLFGDQDMAMLTNCGGATHCKPPKYPGKSIELAACCYDIAVKTLLAPEIQYAAVNFYAGGYLKNISRVDYLGFSHVDCSDGALNAFHHAAVPVILPYIELLDEQSWWESQGLHFHLITNCFPGYSVYSNIFDFKFTADHSSYPRGRLPGAEIQKTLIQVYGKYDLIPDIISRSSEQMFHGNCAKLNHQKMGLNGSFEPYNHQNRAAAALFSTYGKSQAWQELPSFKKCLAALQPRFSQYVETGDLRRIDG